ncbi:hypothetical protein CBF86_01680 [Limosilactobacillus reuteri]|uniref:hypothetical protein n=1 Tax=Limosilactobacillus reuteri TaxID=1598 RepID=UPI000B98398F|nr:hypothetical protein [Limosilactobacillus reuteri]OYS49385.1 hypothetical protein CBF84_06455 [Limosilactobacillus reuteri]OYS49781.1 hypothetical protein CBF86_01680 [Limosilactobacillus reuteri]OYS55428.1 hypothetical protein CBF95_06590 [Limosilactobacillus reuteri]OYS57728.1 hypothetical protein CBF93_08545 [Limosilactobacillus reuteri]OYS65880.1 hypothetical protein CBF99_06810 [Limosilactobacillus reuteri]
MKIKEAIEIINGTTSTVSAEETNNLLYIYHRNLKAYNDWFLMMHISATSWDFIGVDWDCLSNIKPQDLARVMDVIQRLLDTPVKERFPEKKYCLRWFDDDAGKTFLGFCENWGQKYWSLFDTQTSSTIFTESELEQFKRENPKLAPAIDAMKEPAEDKDE